MSLDAYRKSQAAAETPRQTEYRLFGRVTGALIEARDKGLTGAALMRALDWNRRLWSTLALDCGTEGNGLPPQTRAQIISLSIYVSKTTSKVVLGQATIDDLISINKIIMEGLAARAGTAPADAADRPSLPAGGLVG
ncbi:MAG: flagellar biosynthesis regulator FlaF [Rhodothalassiaceae bacterium]